MLEAAELTLLFELKLLELNALLGLLTLLELDEGWPGADELDEDETLRVERLELDSDGRELDDELYPLRLELELLLVPPHGWRGASWHGGAHGGAQFPGTGGYGGYGG